MLILLYHIIWD